MTMVKGDAQFAELHDVMMRDFEASGCHTMVLSAEALSGSSMSKDLLPMAVFAKDFDIEVICYLRRQDYFAEAFWNQR